MSGQRWNLDDYEPVEARLERFWNDHPNGRVLTEIVYQDDKRWVVKAAVYRDAKDERPAATGYAEETIGSNPVNRTSALENCETSSAGRALANLGYAAKGKRPSREEMQKAQRSSAHSAPPTNKSGDARKGEEGDQRAATAEPSSSPSSSSSNGIEELINKAGFGKVKVAATDLGLPSRSSELKKLPASDVQKIAEKVA